MSSVEIKDYNITDGKSYFEIPIKSKETTNGKIIEISRSNDYTTGHLLGYEYFSMQVKLIAIDLSKQKTLKNPNTRQQIIFIDGFDENTPTILFIF